MSVLSLIYGSDEGEAANPPLQFVQDPRQRPAPIQRPDPVYRPGEEPRARRAPQPAPAAAPPAMAQQTQPAPQPGADLSGESAYDLMFKPDAPAATPAPAMAQPKPQQGADTGIDWTMPDADIRAAIRTLPKDAQKSARDEWAKRRVATERTGGTVQNVSDVARNLVRGTPVGSWLDEALAGARALGGANFDEEVALERARNQAIDDSSTKLGSLPVIGDVTAGGVTKLIGGILSAPFTPAVRLMQGATMLPRVVNSAATGATYGALYGTGEGTDAGSRATSGAAGLGIGLGLGIAAPIVGSGVGNVVGGVRRAVTPTPAQLQGLDRGAVNRVARAATDDILTGANYRVQSQRLGQEAMLADMGENLRGQAGAIANAPGAGQTTITRALEDRRAGAANRIRLDVNKALGQPVNVPRSIAATQKAANEAAGPLYQEFYATRIVPTDRLNELLQRIPQRAYSAARQMAAAEGIPLRTHRTRGVDAVELDYIKRALDDLAKDAQNKGRGNATRVWSGLARDLRTEVDTILSPDDPAQSVWAQARRASGEGLSFEEAVEAGQSAFRKNLSPDQMELDMEGMTPHQLAAYRVGARDSIRTTMGNAGAAYGSNADVAARKQLQTNFAQDKLRLVTERPEDANRIINRLARESEFADTEDAVLRNSATSRRLAAQAEFPGPIQSNVIGRELGQRGLTGVALEGAYRLGNLVVGGALDERRSRIAENAARMLVAQGVERDQIAAGLRQFIQQRNLRRNQVQAVEAVIQRVMEGARQPAISNTVGE